MKVNVVKVELSTNHKITELYFGSINYEALILLYSNVSVSSNVLA